MVWPVVTLFERLMRSYLCPNDATDHCDQWPHYFRGQWEALHCQRSVLFVMSSDHKFWEVSENVFMAGGVQPHCDQWPHDLRDLGEAIHIQRWLKLIVTSGHTIWEDNEKLFTAGSGQRSLWPVDTLFERSLRSYSWLGGVHSTL